jgi:hypothetical protein
VQFVYREDFFIRTVLLFEVFFIFFVGARGATSNASKALSVTVTLQHAFEGETSSVRRFRNSGMP